MNEAHQRFHDWLSTGADGDPPRDVAVHASVCTACQQSIAALDLLAMVNPGLASMPAEPTGRERSRLVVAGRLLGATAVLFGAAILGVGVSQLVGVSPTNGPVAQGGSSPEQSVMGAEATPQGSSEATPAPQPTPQETLSPLGTQAPINHPPAVTPGPIRTAAPTPTSVSTPSPSPSPSVSEPPPSVSEPPPSVSESPPSVSEPPPSVSEPPPSASEPPTSVSEPPPSASASP